MLISGSSDTVASRMVLLLRCVGLILVMVALPLFGRAASVDADWRACAAAGAAAERQFGIPGGLLLAIGRVESGRTGPDGVAAPWPWTINAAGQGHTLPAREEAVAAVRDLLAGGTASIDVGCFQVNLMYHPAAFASIEEAFDPVANAVYAARFLTQLRDRENSWEAAVAAYHSATPARGLPYRDRVLANWGGTAPAVIPVSVPDVVQGVRVVTPAPAGSAPGVIVLRVVAGLPVLTHGRP